MSLDFYLRRRNERWNRARRTACNIHRRWTCERREEMWWEI